MVIFDDLMKLWRMIFASWKDGTIRTGMYYYLVGVIFVVGGLYIYLLWQGYVGFAVIFSTITGAQSGLAIDVVQAAGILIVVRYMILGGIDAIAKSKPAELSERLMLIEDKVNALHRLAFHEEEDDDEPEEDNEKEDVKIIDKIKGTVQRDRRQDKK